MLVLPVSSAADWWSDVLLLIQMTEYDMNLVYISIATLVGHSLLSSFIIFFDSPVNSRCFRFSLHLFQALVIYEVYQAMKVGRVSYEVHQIRVLEGCFESGPQALLQLYFLSKYTNDYSIALISLSFSLLCLANVSNYSDSFGLKGSTSINYWNTILISLRTFELALRFSLLVISTMYLENSVLSLISFLAAALLDFIPTVIYLFFIHDKPLPPIEILQIAFANVLFMHPGSIPVFFFTNLRKALEFGFLFSVCMYLPVSHETKALLTCLLAITSALFLYVYISDEFDSKLYTAVINKDRKSLFTTRKHDIIIRMIQRKQMTKLDSYQSSTLRRAGLTVNELVKDGLDIDDLKDIGYLPKDLEDYFGSDELITKFEFSEFTGFSARELHDLGFTIEDLRLNSISAADMEDAHFSAEDLKRGGYELQELISAGFSTDELINAKFSYSQLAKYCDCKELTDEGAGVNTLRGLGFSLEDLQESFSRSHITLAGLENELEQLEKLHLEQKVSGMKAYGNALHAISMEGGENSSSLSIDSVELLDIDEITTPTFLKKTPRMIDSTNFEYENLPLDPLNLSFTEIIIISTPPITPHGIRPISVGTLRVAPEMLPEIAGTPRTPKERLDWNMKQISISADVMTSPRKLLSNEKDEVESCMPTRRYDLKTNTSSKRLRKGVFGTQLFLHE